MSRRHSIFFVSLLTLGLLAAPVGAMACCLLELCGMDLGASTTQEEVQTAIVIDDAQRPHCAQVTTTRAPADTEIQEVSTESIPPSDAVTAPNDTSPRSSSTSSVPSSPRLNADACCRTMPLRFSSTAITPPATPSAHAAIAKMASSAPSGSAPAIAPIRLRLPQRDLSVTPPDPKPALFVLHAALLI